MKEKQNDELEKLKAAHNKLGRRREMNIGELVEFLKTFPREMEVVYRCHSEQCSLEKDYIRVESLCEPRSDGWVANARPDKPLVKYLVFPGN